MTVQGINRFQECVAQNTDPLILELKYIFSTLPFVSMSRCLLVCKTWHNWARPLWSLRVQENLAKLEFLPPAGNKRAELKILLTTAKAAACVNSNQAKSILSHAKEVAINWKPERDADHELSFLNERAMKDGLLSEKQDVIDTLILIVELETYIDKDHAIQSLEGLKDLAGGLSELDKSYAHFKIAQLEVDIGIEGASTALSSAKETFLEITEKVKLEIHNKGRGTDFLISLAWLEAQVCLERAEKTLKFASFMSSSSAEKFYKRIGYIIVTLKGSASLDPQQQEIFSQLCNSHRKYWKMLEIPEEANKPQAAIITVENLEMTKAFELQLNPSTKKGLTLIAIARIEATFDSTAAWNTLKNVMTFVPKLEYSAYFGFTSPAYLVMCLAKETLRI